MWRAILLFVCISAPALAQPIQMADYDALSRLLNQRADFEILPRRSEPGFSLDALYRHRGIWLGERLDGQQLVAGAVHDRLAGTPVAPLALRAGAAGQNLSVAFHRGFGSNALFPLGRLGFPQIAARGEGAFTAVFDQDQAAFGLKIHSGYRQPLGGGAKPGTVTLAFYDRAGRQIARTTHKLETGINALGFRRPRWQADIAAVTVENDDPGGVAVDDLIFDLRAPVG